MKFNKKNRLIKVLFILFLAVACFSIDNVSAASVAQGSLSSITKKDMYCIYDGSSSTKNQLAITYDDKFIYYAGFKQDPDSLSNSLANVVTISNNTLYCPKEIVACSNYSSGSDRDTNRKTYIVSNKQECIKKFNATAINHGAYATVLTFNEKNSKKSVAYDYTVNNGVCIAAFSDTEFSGIYEAAKQLKNATVYSEENASRTNRINNYVNNNQKKAFCNQEELNFLKETVTHWNTVVSKDSAANKAQKEKAESQAETTTKNVEKIITQMQNQANITLPNDNPVENTCEGLIDEDLRKVIDIVLNIVRIGAPILLIILIAVDFGQVVISNDKEAMPKAISRAIKRGIAAIAIFFIPYLVNLIIDWLNSYGSISGSSCIK